MKLFYTKHARQRAKERHAPILKRLPSDAREVEDKSDDEKVAFTFRHGGENWVIILRAGEINNGAIVISIMNSVMETPVVHKEDRKIHHLIPDIKSQMIRRFVCRPEFKKTTHENH
jgi:hypothetical protein